MFSRRTISKSLPSLLSPLITTPALTLLIAAAPSLAIARQTPSDIDMITTSSIPSQAMLWTVDPSIILMLLVIAFVALSVAGFALTRRSVRDSAVRQQKQLPRPFE